MNQIEVRVRQHGKPYLRVRLSKSPATIGRDPKADIHLDSSKVSRIHAHLHFDEDGVRIVDADSRNGVRVDGAEQLDAPLTPEQTVSICEFTFRVRPLQATNELRTTEEAANTARDVDDGPEELDDAVSKGWSEGAAEIDDDTSVGRRPKPADNVASASLSATEGEPGLEEARSMAGDPTTARPAGEDDDDDEDYNDVVPADAPSVLELLRNTPSELTDASVSDRDVVLEVLVATGTMVHEVALLTPGQQFWWGGTPGFPKILFTVPTIARFPLAIHERAGRYHVQVPQNSTWKMFRRGAGNPAVHRSGPLVVMRR
jgi:pSer/pThr/pTyr-binding forkhead associated (FHA) protein